MRKITDCERLELEDFVRRNSIDRVAEKVLFAIGLKSSLLGTAYLREAIVIKYNNPRASVGRDIYPQIARTYNLEKSACVERSIRHSLTECFNADNLICTNDLVRAEVVDKHFGATNSEFICALCTWIHITKTAEICQFSYSVSPRI